MTSAFFLLYVIALLPLFTCRHSAGHNRFLSDEGPRGDAHPKRRVNKPNIVIILTDDQDVELGSLKHMKKLRRYMKEEGAELVNAFVTTPMCCPSRSSFLTGLYVHNHNVYTNNHNCSSREWQETHEKRTFATYLSNAGYRTGYFGKYLNEYDGNSIPPGWREWLGLIKNSKYYNYTLNFNSKKIRHDDNYAEDYFTDLIANDSVAFFKMSKQYFPHRPVAMVLSVPSPHGTEDPAPQFQDMFVNNTDHRTLAYDHAPNPDKQWLLQHTGKMEPIHIQFTDHLQRRRLQCLQSVDDLVEQVVTELDRIGELENTFVVYTSDHGYHLGQFGLIKGKAMPFEFDIKVPFFVRGPGVPKRIQIENMVSNIDIAPTILEMAGIDPPEHMDGTSFFRFFQDIEPKDMKESRIRLKSAWRQSVLIERGIPVKHPELQLLEAECQKAEFRSPCDAKTGQQFECVQDVQGRLRMRKCRKMSSGCNCSHSLVNSEPGEAIEEVESLWETQSEEATSLGRVRRSLHQKWPDTPDAQELLDKCRIFSNSTVFCQNDIISSKDSWQKHKALIDRLIYEYKSHIDRLRDIRKYLRHSKPEGPLTTAAAVAAASVTTVESSTRESCECEEPSVRDNPRKRQRKKSKLRGRRKHVAPEDDLSKSCNQRLMKCFVHDNNHWKTPPYWTAGRFCFCPNANNNTYWCLRTLNATHNFLFCEFIYNFYSYYDINEDPYQLRNAVGELTGEQRAAMETELETLKWCKGSKQCTKKSKPERRSSTRRRQRP